MLDAVNINDSTIYGSAWADTELRPLFTEQNQVKGWLEVMVVLAQVQADFGLIPWQAAVEIESAYQHINIDETFLQEVGENFAKTNHSLLGFIHAVKNRCGSTGGEWLCYGATVQDITDTHTVRTLLQVLQCFVQRLLDIQRILVTLAIEHKHTVMCGRTHAQPGLPITFGFKAASWLDELMRHLRRLLELRPRMAVGQLCGGVGSLSSLGPQAMALQYAFMQRLGLSVPAISWTSSRDRFAEWLNLLAMLAATGDRIGQEVTQLQRPEIGELSEGFVEGAVGSITMPQKRNPEISEHLGTLARVVRHHASYMAENLVHSHERDGRAWKGEWWIIPAATLAAGKSLTLLKVLLNDLQVDKDRMLNNLLATKGFIHAEAVMLRFAKQLGKQSAHQLVYEISMAAHEQGLDLQQALRADSRIATLLGEQEWEELFDIGKATACCAAMVDQVIQGC